jgi:hypothetical protein
MKHNGDRLLSVLVNLTVNLDMDSCSFCKTVSCRLTVVYSEMPANQILYDRAAQWSIVCQTNCLLFLVITVAFMWLFESYMKLPTEYSTLTRFNGSNVKFCVGGFDRSVYVIFLCNSSLMRERG